MAEYKNIPDWKAKDPEGKDPDPYYIYQGDKVPLKPKIYDEQWALTDEAFDTVTAEELQKTYIPPLEVIIDKILPVGLAVLGAPPKSYKSFMCLDMALCICKGFDFLGFDTKKSGVLYLDLESTKRRPKTRLELILKGEKAPNNLYIGTKAKRIDNGFEEQLKRELDKHPDIKLVIVDVFKRIRQPMKRNIDPYERDYEDYSAVKKIADKYNIAILLVVHTTKMKHPDDPFNELIGSSGVMGSIDVAMVIKKEERSSKEAKLYVTGRDLEDQCFEITFNKDTFRWKNEGDYETVKKNREIAEYENSPVIRVLRQILKDRSYNWTGNVSDIITISHFYEIDMCRTPEQVGKELNKFKELLEERDGVEFEYVRKGKEGKREYHFKNVQFDKTTVRPVSTEQTVIPVRTVSKGNCQTFKDSNINASS